MSQIKVKVRSDIGEPGRHPVLGELKPGQEVTIEEDQFGAGLFERPSPEWLSPHELADKNRAAAEGKKVGDFEPPVDPQPTVNGQRPTDNDSPVPEAPAKATKAPKEVI
jgi:hypothetical protein